MIIEIFNASRRGAGSNERRSFDLFHIDDNQRADTQPSSDAWIRTGRDVRHLGSSITQLVSLGWLLAKHLSFHQQTTICQNQIKSSLYSSYYAEACNKLRGPSPRLSAWATQLRRNVATVASRWRHCADLTGPGIELQISRTDSARLATDLTAGTTICLGLEIFTSLQCLSSPYSNWEGTVATSYTRRCVADSNQRTHSIIFKQDKGVESCSFETALVPLSTEQLRHRAVGSLKKIGLRAFEALGQSGIRKMGLAHYGQVYRVSPRSICRRASNARLPNCLIFQLFWCALATVPKCTKAHMSLSPKHTEALFP